MRRQTLQGVWLLFRQSVWDKAVSFLQELKVRELDVSYCNLPTSVITSLLTRATTLEVCPSQLPTPSQILPDVRNIPFMMTFHASMDCLRLLTVGVYSFCMACASLKC